VGEAGVKVRVGIESGVGVTLEAGCVSVGVGIVVIAGWHAVMANASKACAAMA
jgi:hypothetical protein